MDSSETTPTSASWVEAWARRSGPAKLLAAARRRFEQRGVVAGALRVELSPDERRDVGGLLGISWQMQGGDVTGRALDKALAPHGTTLRDFVEHIGGPIRDLSGERAAAQARRNDERDKASGLLTDAGVPTALVEWVLTVRALPPAGSGQLAATAALVARVWRALPSPGHSSALALLAADVLGDPHALDRNTDVGRAVARLAAAQAALLVDPAADLSRTVVTTSSAWRDAWASVRVACDQLSSTVLVLNLPLAGLSTAAALAATAAVSGEPLWLTTRMLAGEWELAAGVADVFVCENPAVVEAAANRLGSASAPLVCTYGVPSDAVLRLLRKAALAGATLHVRADDDGGGQRIVAALRQAVPTAALWRYEERPVVEAEKAPVYEEQLLDGLLADLQVGIPRDDLRREGVRGHQ